MTDWFVSYTAYDAEFNPMKHGVQILPFDSAMSASDVLAAIDKQLCADFDINPNYLQYNAFNRV
ncbi:MULTISPECIES: hypothetical protein [unclassified Citrobacter]|uniref:hypothetical protein n=1 Tax=unclassified Citrobacter TaxID=2644389 RepID=UPI0015EAB7C5|nr:MULTISPECIES: hypothetical protein [unclassified Citrobacter]MBA7874125.1 hypothetical protein [Citrobacter sp. RHBSTW-00827]MBA7939903.1 hypothetical protein [Citrobacter sp. RHBSTW-00509]QLS95936.1 hypothetical protein HV302_19255 [Citrobacter sp. RHBSTW-00859]QLT55311.1 hypothetical protein HV285_19315 [Citrobacter sp. RHBSTW-00821]QLU31593.1 hypothetical protein HV199_19290 [Citrobacter sp. RHBSTW-00446]